jgi:hypothetical protein
MITCVIIHNMIIEDERDCNFESLFDLTNVEQLQLKFTFQTHMEGTSELENSQTHFNMKLNLVEHLWVMKGYNNCFKKISNEITFCAIKISQIFYQFFTFMLWISTC